MPLYREWNSDPYSLAAIWKIEEPESFFAERTGMEPDIRHDQRRIERLAGRFLLKHLKEDFPILTIAPDEHDKPRIGNNDYYFSISHSWPYVAAVVSPYVEAGIDIQCWHPRIEKIQHKFLSAEEQLLFRNDVRLITLAWSMKEAAYKWQGRRGVEFIEHMPVQHLNVNDNTYTAAIKMELLQNEGNLSVEGIVEPDFSCAYVIHENVFHPAYK
ncbi:MAG: 4'-phosphopantetheinyl transferase superfamily protein [Sphingobacteriales bacterium]|nr:MAG: 4'-phosphopantetheinyl transferase superfamily protein [Sphingobacteriales bacterium]